jgi:hypothetical protein
MCLHVGVHAVVSGSEGCMYQVSPFALDATARQLEASHK